MILNSLWVSGGYHIEVVLCVKSELLIFCILVIEISGNKSSSH